MITLSHDYSDMTDAWTISDCRSSKQR